MHAVFSVLHTYILNEFMIIKKAKWIEEAEEAKLMIVIWIEEAEV